MSEALRTTDQAKTEALALRDRVLKLAGYDMDEMVRDFAASVVVLREGMRAMKTEHYVVPGARGEGATLVPVEGVDHATRLRAARDWRDMVGIDAGRRGDQGDATAPGHVVNVNVSLVDMSPTAKLVPQNVAQLVQGEVIDVQPAGQRVGTPVATPASP